MQTFESIFGTIVLLFSILSIGALSGLFAERSGTINIAIEGLMTFGALFYAISGHIFHSISNMMQYLSLLISGIGAAIVSILFAYAAISLRANQVIAGTAINLLAAGVGIYLAVNSLWTDASVIRSGYTTIYLAPIDFLSSINSFIIIAIAIIGISWSLINLTKWGLRLRACGENPQAADAAGVNVIKMRYIAISISGFLAGIAGGMFIHKSAYLFNGNVQGYGFIALTIMIFGQWRTSFITIAAIIFSTLTAIALEGKFIYGLDQIPSEIISMMPYIISIVTLAIISKRSRVPKAVGKPFKKIKN